MKKTRVAVSLVSALLVGGFAVAQQAESPVLTFNRGKLWSSIFYGKSGPNFNNWGKRGVGLDWPGFDESWIQEDIGGSPSHMATGGIILGAKRDSGNVLAVEDWAIYGTTISANTGAKYKIVKHGRVFPDGINNWLKADARRGEEVFETIWEYNLDYSDTVDRRYQLPVRVRRTLHQWSGSRRDENYIIVEYVIKNISNEIKAADPSRTAVPDTLLDMYSLVTYAMHSNSRSWSVLFPTLTPGARNTAFNFDPTRKMIWARAGGYRDAPGTPGDYGYSGAQGPIVNGSPSGEWLAPGFVGIRLLYATRDNTGVESNLTFSKVAWSAASSSIDLSGPLLGKGSLEERYALVKDPTTANNSVRGIEFGTDTTYMRRSRMWSMMSLGPWTLLPGDSVVVALAEMVDGVEYNVAVRTPATGLALVGPPGQTIFNRTSEKAKFTYDQYRRGNGFNHPDPPPAPTFTLDYARDREKFAATVISWGTEAEGLSDADDNSDDLAGYNVYRSDYLPIGPWDLLASVKRGDPTYFDAATQKYRVIDSSGNIGVNYYYAVTAFDTGKAAWPVDPSAVFTQTDPAQPVGRKVPPLESSIYANRTITPFKMTLPPLQTSNEVLVVPNPFIIGAGSSQPGAGDEILFVNLPNPCTIRIYSIRGDLVKTISVPEGFGGIASWDQVTDFGMFVESGIYLFHIESKSGTKVGKFAIVR